MCFMRNAAACRPERVAGAVARGCPLAYCAAFSCGGAKDVTVRRVYLHIPALRMCY